MKLDVEKARNALKHRNVAGMNKKSSPKTGSKEEIMKIIKQKLQEKK